MDPATDARTIETTRTQIADQYAAVMHGTQELLDLVAQPIGDLSPIGHAHPDMAVVCEPSVTAEAEFKPANL
jgi:hypothetical protein